MIAAGKSVFKDRLDEGIARSIFESERRLTDMARQQYPAIKKIRQLEWGYKLVDRDVNEKVCSWRAQDVPCELDPRGGPQSSGGSA